MDDQYIKKVLDGDIEAFRYLLNKYKSMVYSIALSLIKDQFVAEEVTQDVFVNAYRSLKSFNKKAKFSTWIYKIAYNEALKKLKKNKQEFLTFQENYPGEIEDVGIVISLKKKEQKLLISNALNMLPPQESLALRLFYLEEESIKNVAKITGWSNSKVKVTLHRARKNMYVVFGKILNQEDRV